jgi:hypothetical protein
MRFGRRSRAPALAANQRPTRRSGSILEFGLNEKTAGDASSGFSEKWSGRRDSNSRRPPWQGGALPTELRPQNRVQGVGRPLHPSTAIFGSETRRRMSRLPAVFVTTHFLNRAWARGKKVIAGVLNPRCRYAPTRLLRRRHAFSPLTSSRARAKSAGLCLRRVREWSRGARRRAAILPPRRRCSRRSCWCSNRSRRRRCAGPG